MRSTKTILIGLCFVLGSCRSPNGSSLEQTFNTRMSGFTSSLGTLFGREDRISGFKTTTGNLVRIETEPKSKAKSNQSKYLFWERNLDRLSDIDLNSLGHTVVVGPRVPKAPGVKGFLSPGSVTDPLQRGEHFSTSLKQILVLEQRWPDLAGWQSSYRD